MATIASRVVGGSAATSSRHRGGDRVEVRRAEPARCGAGLFDLDAALRGIDHAHAIARRIDHHREIAFRRRSTACSTRQASTWWPFSRVPISRAHGRIDLRHRHAAQHAARLAAPADRHLRLDDPRPGAGQVGDRQAPSPARWPARRCRASANSALPSASISSTSIGSQAEDALAEIHVADDLLADQVAQRLRRAAADRAIARAAIEPRHRVFVGEAEAAMQLHRLGGDTQRHLVVEDLSPRRP